MACRRMQAGGVLHEYHSPCQCSWCSSHRHTHSHTALYCCIPLTSERCLRSASLNTMSPRASSVLTVPRKMEWL